MSKKVSIVVICIIIAISLVISIYIPNREKIEENEDTSINYEVLQKEGKVGITKNGETIIEPQYDDVIIPNSHRAVFMCKTGDNHKFVNQQNKEIFKEYDNVNLIQISDDIYEKNVLTYEDDGKYGLLSITGKEVTKAKYEEIYNLGYKEGEVVVKQDGKYGVLYENGSQKIENKYDSIRSDEYYTIDNGYKKSGYIVQKITDDGYRYGYYDKDGEKVLNEEYNYLNRLTQIESDKTYLIVAQNGQYGVFVNNSKIINTQYQTIEYNSDLEIFIIERTGKYGATNINGKEILKPEYTELQINGIYIYTTNEEEKKVWDKTGKEVEISFETVIQKANSEYYIKSEEGNYSILNSNFEPITKQNYKYLELAYNNYFIATNEQDKTGIIDLQENIIVNFKYDVIQLVKEENRLQAIDFATNETVFYDNNISVISD